MSRSIVFSLMIVTGFVGGTLFLGDRLPLRPAHLSAAEVQPEPAAPQGDQPEVTERGLPGQAFPPKPGLAKPGGQPSIQKVPILPKLQASPPPPAKAPAPPRNPAVAAKRRPSLSETLNVLGSMPGGAEVIANATQRGAKVKTQQTLGGQALGQYLANPGPWSVTLSPQRASIGSWDNPMGSLELRGLELSGFIGNLYFFSADTHHTYSSQNYRAHWPPVALFSVRVPRDGWYVVDCEVGAPWGLARAVLQKRLASGNTDRLIYSFVIDYDEHEYRRSLPQLVELAAGMHHFSLEIQEGILEFLEVSVTELER